MKYIVLIFSALFIFSCSDSCPEELNGYKPSDYICPDNQKRDVYDEYIKCRERRGESTCAQQVHGNLCILRKPYQKEEATTINIIESDISDTTTTGESNGSTN